MVSPIYLTHTSVFRFELRSKTTARPLSVGPWDFLAYFSAIGRYARSLRINCGCWLAWAKTEIPACSNTWDWVKFAVSAAKFAS